MRCGCSLTPYPLSEGEGSRMLCGCSLTPMPLSKGDGSRMLCGRYVFVS